MLSLLIDSGSKSSTERTVRSVSHSDSVASSLSNLAKRKLSAETCEVEWLLRTLQSASIVSRICVIAKISFK